MKGLIPADQFEKSLKIFGGDNAFSEEEVRELPGCWVSPLEFDVLDRANTCSLGFPCAAFDSQEGNGHGHIKQFQLPSFPRVPKGFLSCSIPSQYAV